jgi:hypothetical protein
MPGNGKVLCYKFGTNIVLSESVEKTRELGFNISKMFENHLKQLLTQFLPVSIQDNFNSACKNSNWWAGLEPVTWFNVFCISCLKLRNAGLKNPKRGILQGMGKMLFPVFVEVSA